MVVSENLIINIAFSVFILIMVYLNYYKLLKTNVGQCLSGLAIIISVMLLFFTNYNILDVAHFLYSNVYLVVVAFLSSNPYLLGLNILMLTFIISTRYYYKNCILESKRNNKGFFFKLFNYVKKNIWFWDTDYYYLVLLLVTCGRLLWLNRYQIVNRNKKNVSKN